MTCARNGLLRQRATRQHETFGRATTLRTGVQRHRRHAADSRRALRDDFQDETDRPFRPEKNLRIAWPTTPWGRTVRQASRSPGTTGRKGQLRSWSGDKWLVYFDKYRDHEYGMVASEDSDPLDRSIGPPEDDRRGPARDGRSRYPLRSPGVSSSCGEGFPAAIQCVRSPLKQG